MHAKIDGFHKPVVYQRVNGARKSVPAKLIQTADSQIGFVTGTYDHSHALIIDPVLSYSTYLGGSDTDNAFRIVVDSGGNAYVVGYTASSDFPTKNAFATLSRKWNTWCLGVAFP